jgi:tetratricopeptide (TPR) repeat protein
MAVTKIWPLAPLAAALIAASLAGCMSAQIEENTRQLTQQKAELEKLQNEIAALNAAASASAPAPAGSCDPDVSRIATRRGGERFAASDFGRALGYYDDALAACPGSARAELNVARAYEALGQRADAIKHYQQAAKGGGDGGDEAAQDAHAALSRLGIK